MPPAPSKDTRNVTTPGSPNVSDVAPSQQEDKEARRKASARLSKGQASSRSTAQAPPAHVQPCNPVANNVQEPQEAGCPEALVVQGLHQAIHIDCAPAICSRAAPEWDQGLIKPGHGEQRPPNVAQAAPAGLTTRLPLSLMLKYGAPHPVRL